MSSQIKIRSPKASDASNLYQLAHQTQGIDGNSEYFYHHILKTHSDTCLVLEKANIISGCCLAYPLSNKKVFIWQFFVSPNLQGNNIGSQILQLFLSRTRFNEIQTTVVDSRVKEFFQRNFINAGFAVSDSIYIHHHDFFSSHSEETLLKAKLKEA